MEKQYKFLVIQHGYHPYADADSICMEYVAKEINKRNIPIDFYVYKHKNDEVDKQDGINNVFYFLNSYQKILLNLEKKGKPYPTLTKRQKLIPRIKIKLLKLLNYPNSVDILSDTTNIKKVLNRVRIENEKQPYTHMINVCCPFGTMKVATRIKKAFPNIKWAFYMLDPYEYCYFFPTEKIPKRKKRFKKHTKNLDLLVMLHGIAEEHDRQGYDNGFKDSTLRVCLPNLQKPKADGKSSTTLLDKKNINLSYAGSLWKKVRNPDKMLEILGSVNLPNMRLNFFGMACDYLNEFNKTLDERFVLHGTKSHDVLKNYLSESDILVNIGNAVPNQAPSKVFEYIATGKPIINFCVNENDTSLYYLKRYPLCFNINVTNYTDKDILALESFINKNKGKQVTFEEATKNLQEVISENICAKIVDSVLDC